MDLTVFSVAVLLTAVGAGVVGAILGLGGGILLIPILTLFFGVDLHYAMGASIISVIINGSARLRRRRDLRMAPKRLIGHEPS